MKSNVSANRNEKMKTLKLFLTIGVLIMSTTASAGLDSKAKGLSTIRAVLDFATGNKSLYGDNITVHCGPIQHTGVLVQINNDLLVLKREVRTKIISGPNEGKTPVAYSFIDLRTVTSVAFEMAE